MPIQCEEKNYKHSVFLILQKIWKKISKKNIFLKNWTFKNKLGHAHKYQTHFYEVLGNWPSFSLFISNILVAKTGSITKFLGAIALSYPPPPLLLLMALMKKRGWKLCRSPNPNPRGVRKCNSANFCCN